MRGVDTTLQRSLEQRMETKGDSDKDSLLTDSLPT